MKAAENPNPPQVLHAGWLAKKSPKNRHNWQRRYFVLCGVGLLYFKDRAACEAGDRRGWVPLDQIVQVEVATSGKGSEDGRRLNLKVQGDERVFELMAESREACTEWARVINETLQMSLNLEGMKLSADWKLPALETILFQGTPWPVLHSGVLSKKSTVNRHLWQARFFVLCRLGLLYYKNREAVDCHQWRGCIYLSKISRVDIASVGKGSESGRRINLEIEGFDRVFELMTERKETCQQWATHLQKAILNARIEPETPDLPLVTMSHSSVGLVTHILPNKEVRSAIDPNTKVLLADKSAERLAERDSQKDKAQEREHKRPPLGSQLKPKTEEVPEDKKFAWALIEGLRVATNAASGKPPPDPQDQALWEEEMSHVLERPGGETAIIDYAPRVFREFRRRLGFTSSVYLKSWDYNFMDLPSFGAGRSGGVSLRSRDNRFLLKTVPPEHAESLMRVLKDLYNYFGNHPNTRLAPVVGLHRFCDSATYGFVSVIIFVNTVYLPNATVDARFEVKAGKKLQSDPRGTLHWKSSLARTFHCSDADHDSVLAGLREDCAWLRDHNLLNFSLLVGVHYREGVDFDNASTTSSSPSPSASTNLSASPTTSTSLSTATAAPRTVALAPPMATAAEIKGHDEVYLISIIDYFATSTEQKVAHFFKSLRRKEAASIGLAASYHDVFVANLPTLFQTCQCKQNIADRRKTQTAFRERYITHARRHTMAQSAFGHAPSDEEEEDGDELREHVQLRDRLQCTTSMVIPRFDDEDLAG